MTNVDYEEESKMTRQSRKLDENKLLMIAILAPIILLVLIVFIMTGLPLIAKAIKAICTYVFPNFWVILIYAYVALISYLLGRKSKK